MPLLDNTKISMFSNREPVPQPQSHASNSANQSRDMSQPRSKRRGSQGRSDNRQHLGSSTANRRPETASLKVTVPNITRPEKPTNLKHQTSQSTLDEVDNGRNEILVKQESIPRPRSRNSYTMWNASNDDSTEITTGEAGWESDGDYSGEATARWAPDLLNQVAGVNWRQEADAGRALMGRAPKYATTTNYDHANTPVGDDESLIGIGDDDEEEGEYSESSKSLRDETPSRATKSTAFDHAPRPQKTHTQGKKKVTIVAGNEKTVMGARNEHDSSPLPGQGKSTVAGIPQQPDFQGNSLSRHITYRQQVESIPSRQEATSAPLLVKTAPAKVSGHHEVSEEELLPESQLQPMSGAVKRPHDGLDYDTEDLQRKTYADLDHVPFLTDPRAPEPPAAVDVNGTTLSISQRLMNLSKMRPEDQESLFRSLTDDENEQVGQWFVQTFQESLTKLMERRLERRKIAMKYEAEVKKREMGVNVKIGDVEDELKQLRKGGGELIEGRSVAGVGGTPKGK